MADDVSQVESLVRAGESRDIHDRGGLTALHLAAQEGAPAAVEFRNQSEQPRDPRIAD